MSSPTETYPADFSEWSPERRALFLSLLEDEGSDFNSFPLSSGQERLWFLDQLEPGSTAYNVPMAIRLKGEFDVDVLTTSLNEIVNRHEVLRTHFMVVSGKPVQVIRPSLHLPVVLTDLTTYQPASREREVMRLADAELSEPFDLAHGPLIRARLFRLTKSDHVLVVMLHHIITDGVSMSNLLAELGTLSHAFQANQPSPLPPLPLQYSDYAVWQQTWAESEERATQLAYWQKQLAGAPTLALPTDRPRPTLRSGRGSTFTFNFTSEFTTQLRKLSQQHEATLFMTLLAAFQLLLSRYSRQDDVLVGTPIANRRSSELQPLIGFFANTLVLRTNLSGNPSFITLLKRVRETAFSAYAHQDLPFEQLVEALKPERNLGQTPLFQVLFGLQTANALPGGWAGVAIEPFYGNATTAKFDLALYVDDNTHSLEATFEYSTDLFDAPTIERMAGHFRTLLTGIAAHPDRPISEFELLTGDERTQLLTHWNQAAIPGPAAACLPNLFAAQAARTPLDIAAEFEGQTLTYKDLDERSNQLARHLQSLGVKPDGLVALCLDRSLNLLVGLLGILKAGGGYMPVDPTYPAERLVYMFNESQPTVVLTETGLANSLTETTAPIVRMDTDWAAIGQLSAAPVTIDLNPENRLYVIYTSGSTGQPKGVELPHRAIVNLLQWQFEHWTVPAAARTLQFTSIGFDVSCQEIFSALCTGGTVVMVSDALRRDPDHLLASIVENKIERLFLPFTALQQLAEVGSRQSIYPQHLRDVLTAGEQLQLTPVLVNWFEHMPACTLHNQYGPTESHVVTAQPIAPRSPIYTRPVAPIGWPIANTQIYLLDEAMHLVPGGVPGELYIGGLNVARGYLHKPGLTAERFVPNPYTTRPGERLYRTGDLAKYLPDGAIEFLGRADEQVKIRGYRVELGEVEAALLRHPALQTVAAVAWAESAMTRRLVAYVVPKPGVDSPAASELKLFLKQTLPEFMLPSAFVFLDQLPLTASGKVARRLLPPPDRDAAHTENFVLPRTPIEEQVAAIWCSLLEIKQVSIHDDFFGLGGHSLIATQLVARLNEAFDLELPVRTIFDRPTIAELSAIIVEKRSEAADEALLAQMLSDLENLSDDEARTRLNKLAP